MSVQPREHISSSTGTTRCPVELQCCISQDSMRRKPAATAKSLPPSQLDTISQKAKSQTICDGPLPTTARLSRVFSFPQLGTNTNKSTNIIPVIPTQSDSSSRSKRLVRHPSRNHSRHLSSMSNFAQTSSSQHATPFTSTLPRPPSTCVTDIASKRPTNKTSCSLPISVEDETDEESDDTVARYQKIRQLQMARLAKLTRHLGEDIPPELVLSSTLPTNILESRSLVDSLSIHSSKDHRRWRSLDPTEDSQSAPALPSSCKLRKSMSLRDTEGVLRPQTRSERAVNVIDGKLPYVFHPPQTEADLLHSQPTGCIAASINGHDDVYHSLMSTSNAPCGSQDSLHPLPPTLLLTSTPKRSQFHGNPVAAELTLDKISNMECREEKPDKFLGVGINPESISLTDRSLYPTDVAVGIRHSLTQIPPCSQLEVKVQISKRTRFWRMKFGKDVVQTLQSTNPGDIAKQLREMKASI
ncbi:uncharacterized protein HD556DRAFT_1438475 [Suillus plorans]|uniref:Uncharacterized protein n=1 Tax=Suillus plorans TaxID=116603 RepID=A0A9P7DRT0_9AGAM|nr:uncharacterized protein HD556DRAFT_1438475 [Suillus plorans]KAG1801448.1 hypothetical protein HD556DRAFT_1438475 [Suillus plorans]